VVHVDETQEQPDRITGEMQAFDDEV